MNRGLVNAFLIGGQILLSNPSSRNEYEPNELLLEFPFAEDYLHDLDLNQTIG